MMSAPATSNTSHGAVFDFNGKTYFVYHNGSLPGGSGFRRVANIQEVTFNDDGSIDTMEELSTGISGKASTITSVGGKLIGHEEFTNPLDDNSYPLTKSVTAGSKDGNNTKWEIKPGKADASNDSYVSIQSVNKTGLYISVSGSNVILTQDNDNTKSTAMTFITRAGLNGSENSVSFESLIKRGYYLTVSGGNITLTMGDDADACTFNVAEAAEEASTEPEIANAAITDNGVSFDVNNLDGQTVDAYVAQYQDGKLVNVVKTAITVDSDSKSVAVNGEFSGDVRVMLWRENNVEPLVKAVSAE
jgi:hypothetical protein